MCVCGQTRHRSKGDSASLSVFLLALDGSLGCVARLVELQNAASIAGLFLTTEAVVADKPEKNAAPAGGDDMGGMGGMGGF